MTPEQWFQSIRENLAPDELHTLMRQAVRDRIAEAEAMNEAMTGLKVLHREGKGDREGFCVECGHVVPCQTRTFIEPFV